MIKDARYLIKTPNPDKPNGFDVEYIVSVIDYLSRLEHRTNDSDGYRWNGSGWVFDRSGTMPRKVNSKGRSVKRG